MNLTFTSNVGFLVAISIQAGCTIISTEDPEDTTWSVVVTQPVEGSKSNEIHMITSDGQVVHVSGFPIRSCRVAIAETDANAILSIRPKTRLAPVLPVGREAEIHGVGEFESRRIQVDFNFGNDHHRFHYLNDAPIPNWVSSYIESVARIVQRLCPTSEFSDSE